MRGIWGDSSIDEGELGGMGEGKTQSGDFSIVKRGREALATDHRLLITTTGGDTG